MKELLARLEAARVQTWHGSHGRGADSQRITFVLTPQERASLLAAPEYLHAICDAYEAWQSAVEHLPGEGITDPNYPGPDEAEKERHQEEVGALWNALTDALDTALEARQEP